MRTERIRNRYEAESAAYALLARCEANEAARTERATPTCGTWQEEIVASYGDHVVRKDFERAVNEAVTPRIAEDQTELISELWADAMYSLLDRLALAGAKGMKAAAHLVQSIESDELNALPKALQSQSSDYDGFTLEELGEDAFEAPSNYYDMIVRLDSQFENGKTYLAIRTVKEKKIPRVRLPRTKTGAPSTAAERARFLHQYPDKFNVIEEHTERAPLHWVSTPRGFVAKSK